LLKDRGQRRPLFATSAPLCAFKVLRPCALLKGLCVGFSVSERAGRPKDATPPSPEDEEQMKMKKTSSNLHVDYIYLHHN
jgi:hypothetical protein